MPVINVSKLKKNYQIHQKESGLWGALKAMGKRTYTEVRAVNDVSFTINEGELVGFIGPNGAGKTTTLKILSGLLHPTSGKATVLGYQPWERQAVFQKQFSLVMGNKNQLMWDLPAADSFLLNKAIYEIPGDQYERTLTEMVDLLDVGDLLHTQVRKLSLGQRMKMELIAALIHTPKVLFLDEPTIGLDVVMQKKIREFIKAYNLRYKATIILTSHYMDDVKELCDRVIVIDKGSLLFDGDLDQIIKKYSDHKTLTVVFNRKIDKKSLTELGEVVEFESPRAVLRIERAKAPHVASELLNKFDVADMNIEDVQLDDIIRGIFQQKKAA